ncbi:unnamed protein product [Lampetra planeri]
MSKHQKKRNPPVASSDDDENGTQDLLTPGAVVSVMETMVGEVAAPETVGADATSPHQQPVYGWRKVSEQLDLLRAVVVQLVSLVTASMVAGRSTQTSAGGSDQESGVEVSAGSSAGATAGITRAEGNAQLDAAISGGAGEAQTESAWCASVSDVSNGPGMVRSEGVHQKDCVVPSTASEPVTVDRAWDLAGIKDVPAAAEPTAPVPTVFPSPDDPVVGSPPEREQEAFPVDRPASRTRSKCLRFR